MSNQVAIESAAVHTHISHIQGIVSRLAGNSASSKQWCVAIVTAILAIALNSESKHLALLALAPIAVFALLDTHYLALERRYRKEKHEQFVGELQASGQIADKLFDYSLEEVPVSAAARLLGSALVSWSVAPVYIVLALVSFLLAFM